MMRWFLVAILAFVLLVIQTAVFGPGGLAIPVGDHRARPDLLLLVGLFCAFFYRPAEVFVLGWFLGMASDLVSVDGRLGLLALEFSLVLTLVSHFRVALPRGRIVMHFLAALVVVFVVHFVWYIAMRLVDGAWPLVFESAEKALLDAAYSAVLAPYLYWLLLLMKAPLGISIRSAGDER
jgi:cell shape-determining protein MreD